MPESFNLDFSRHCLRVMYGHIDDFEIKFFCDEHLSLDSILSEQEQAVVIRVMRAWLKGWAVADKCNSFQLLQHFCLPLW